MEWAKNRLQETAFIIACVILAFVAIALGVEILTPEILVPCATEDSLNCYWDAETMGNGIGNSYVVDAFGNVAYRD